MEMRRLVTGKQMKEIDGYAIRKVGIPSLVLMERAALAVADEMEKRYGKLSGQRLLVFCGTGNNGADGAALARILFLRGAPWNGCAAGIVTAYHQFGELRP